MSARADHDKTLDPATLHETAPAHDGQTDEQQGLRTIDFVRQAQGGSQAALNKLFGRYVPFVRRLVAIKSGARILSRQEIDDLVQESLLAAFTSFDRFEIRHETSFRAWIHRVVVNQVLRAAERLRAEKNNPDRERPMDQGGSARTTTGPALQLDAKATLPVDKLDRRELQQALDACIATFDEPDRTLLVLRLFVYGDRAPWSEIAPEMGLGADAARMRCNRALKTLREKLQERGFTGSAGPAS